MMAARALARSEPPKAVDFGGIVSSVSMRRCSSVGESSGTFRVGTAGDVGGAVSSVLMLRGRSASEPLRQQEINISSCGRVRRGLSFRNEHRLRPRSPISPRCSPVASSQGQQLEGRRRRSLQRLSMMHVLLGATRRSSVGRRAVVLPLGFLEQICRETVRQECHKRPWVS